MNKTRTLMASITASMIFSTPIPTAAASALTSQHKRPAAPRQQPQTVASADVDKIEEWLDTDREKAKSLQEIQARFSQLTLQQVKAAIDRLIDNNKVLRTGGGTANNPYRYYHRKAGDG